MVFHPFYPDIQHPDLYSMKNLVAYCSAKNIPCTDAMDFLTQKGINDKNCESIYWKMDGHFNGRGYELLAQCVHQFLEQQNWLSEAR